MADKIKRRRTTISAEKTRLKHLLWAALQIYQPNCYLCKEPFVYTDVLPSRGVDNLTEHHKDGDHMNMRIDNRAFTHRVCHKSYHTKDNVNR